MFSKGMCDIFVRELQWLSWLKVKLRNRMKLKVANFLRGLPCIHQMLFLSFSRRENSNNENAIFPCLPLAWTYSSVISSYNICFLCRFCQYIPSFWLPYLVHMFYYPKYFGPTISKRIRFKLKHMFWMCYRLLQKSTNL